MKGAKTPFKNEGMLSTSWPILGKHGVGWGLLLGWMGLVPLWGSSLPLKIDHEVGPWLGCITPQVDQFDVNVAATTYGPVNSGLFGVFLDHF